MRNRRAPKELAKYVVCTKHEFKNGAIQEGFRYFHTQKAAQAWVNEFAREAKFELYRIDYDYYGELKRKAGK